MARQNKPQIYKCYSQLGAVVCFWLSQGRFVGVLVPTPNIDGRNTVSICV